MTACCHIVGIVFLCKCNDSEKHCFELVFAVFSFYHIKADFTTQDSQKLQHCFELVFAVFSFYHIKADFTPQDSQKLQEHKYSPLSDRIFLLNILIE